VGHWTIGHESITITFHDFSKSYIHDTSMNARTDEMECCPGRRYVCLQISVENPEVLAQGSIQLHVVYTLRTTWKYVSGPFWITSVRRRFRDFVWLQKQLNAAGHSPPELPSMHLLGNFSTSYSDSEAIEKRREALQKYLNDLADSNMNETCVHNFLGADDAAFSTTKINLMTNDRFFNRPCSFLMEDEIQKATYTLINLLETSELDEAITSDILDGCVGIAFITMINAGFMFSGRVGTGLVVTRMPNGEWSAPSAVGLAGAGWGLQMGGELIDYMVILSDMAAIESFSSVLQISASTELAIAIGTGVAGETSLNLGADGSRSISVASGQSKGIYFGASFQCSVMGSRSDVNAAFYTKTIDPRDLLSGREPRPPKAQPLYKALELMVSKCSAARRPFLCANGEGVASGVVATSRRCSSIPPSSESEMTSSPNLGLGSDDNVAQRSGLIEVNTIMYANQCEESFKECGSEGTNEDVLPTALAVGVIAVSANGAKEPLITAENSCDVRSSSQEDLSNACSNEETDESTSSTSSSGPE